MLTWGVHPTQAEPYDTIDTMIEAALKAAHSSGLVAVGDKVVLVGGSPSAPPGNTDFLRVVRLS
jgi:pyruvate kinase